MGVCRLYVKNPNSLGTKQKTRVQKGREPCSKGMAFKLCLEEGQEEAKCRWKGIEDPHAKAGRLQAAWASSICTAAARGGSTASRREFDQSGKLCLRDLKHQRKWAWQTVWVCLEEEEEKAHLHRESVMKTVHVLRPENIAVMCAQLSSIIATSCWSEK